MKFQKIVFQNAEYPIRQINLPEFGDVTISISSLNDKILNTNCEYVSDEALYVDEQIFFFIEDEYINRPESEIQQEITKQII